MAAPLPGGASSLVETYEDWGVVCQIAGKATSCVVRQVQSNNQTKQMVLTVEIGRTPDGKLTGALLLPLGLSLAQGAQLKIGDGPARRCTSLLHVPAAGSCRTPRHHR